MIPKTRLEFSGRCEKCSTSKGRSVFRRTPCRSPRGRTGFTLNELLVSIAIITILILASVPNVRRFQTQAKVSASRNNQRILSNALELYRVDHGEYPEPKSTADDAFGIVSRLALRVLTTPVAYVNPSAFADPFGSLKVQTPGEHASGSKSFSGDPFRPPTPKFDIERSLLFFSYPKLGRILRDPDLVKDAYAVVSVGPDLKDSFIMYYPFPKSLPPRSSDYGIETVSDTIYDPTNGTFSGGDLAAFGGQVAVSRFVGGGK